MYALPTNFKNNKIDGYERSRLLIPNNARRPYIALPEIKPRIVLKDALDSRSRPCDKANNVEGPGVIAIKKPAIRKVK